MTGGSINPILLGVCNYAPSITPGTEAILNCTATLAQHAKNQTYIGRAANAASNVYSTVTHQLKTNVFSKAGAMNAGTFAVAAGGAYASYKLLVGSYDQLKGAQAKSNAGDEAGATKQRHIAYGKMALGWLSAGVSVGALAARRIYAI